MIVGTYNENNNDNVPGAIDHIHLPPNIAEADRHDEDEYKTGHMVSGDCIGGRQ
tara:strand:- start:391 stop:552 length:162 start_codon:yes stop_codon:yes gene_type:complete